MGLRLGVGPGMLDGLLRRELADVLHAFFLERATGGGPVGISGRNKHRILLTFRALGTYECDAGLAVNTAQ